MSNTQRNSNNTDDDMDTRYAWAASDGINNDKEGKNDVGGDPGLHARTVRPDDTLLYEKGACKVKDLRVYFLPTANYPEAQNEVQRIEAAMRSLETTYASVVKDLSVPGPGAAAGLILGKASPRGASADATRSAGVWRTCARASRRRKGRAATWTRRPNAARRRRRGTSAC